MDRLLARRLESDKDFRARMVKLAKDYLKVGRDALAYWSSDFDMAYDILSCYTPLNKKDIESMERGHPKRFILPMTATQITTMTTYVAQVLFGQDSPWKVEGRRPEDDLPAEFMNQLLRWNAEQQPTYLLGYLWCQDAIAVNRGVFYNSYAPIFKPKITHVAVPDPEDIDPDTNQPRPYMRARRINEVAAHYCRMEIVSPYDFVCDPALPMWRLQEMRFCGHRTVIPVAELRRRSKLDEDDPAYVLPSAITELVEKAKKGIAQADAAVPSIPGVLANPAEIRLSRSAYERTRALQPTGQVQADKNDTGNVECWELWVKLVPSENKIYDDETSTTGGDPLTTSTPDVNGDPVMFQLLICGGDILLSLNESTYQHGMFPYTVGEGRPNAHFQFSPGWVSILKGIQDYVDWLKNRHKEALSRTVGNIFVYDPACVDVSDFMNPEKEGLLIALKPESAGKKLDEIFKQIPIKDLTENFLEEAMEFVKFAESVTGAGAPMQGVMESGDQSATQFAGTQQMGAGRMTSIARLLSTQALVPQTKQIVGNFQQFLDQAQVVRFKPSDPAKVPPDLQDAAAVTLTRDTIAGDFEFIAHDGTLPGPDVKRVAAITRLLEAAQGFPTMFTPGVPGNFDVKRLLLDGAKASGLDPSNYIIQGPPAPPGGPPGMPLAPPMLPPVAPAAPAGLGRPGPKPAAPILPGLLPPSLPRVAAPQPKPTNS